MSSYWRAAPAFQLLGVAALLLPLMGGACGEPDGAAAPVRRAPPAATTELEGCRASGLDGTLARCTPLPKVERCDNAPQDVATTDVPYRSDDARALGAGSCQDHAVADSFSRGNKRSDGLVRGAL